MTTAGLPIDELRALADAACDGALRPSDAARLEELLRGNPAAQRFYLALVRLDGCLRWEFGQQAREVGLGVRESGFGTRVPPFAAPDSASPEPRIPNPQCEVPSFEPPAPSPEPLIPPIVIDTSPSRFPTPAAFPFSVGGWLFSYAAATVITGVLLVVLWAWKVSHDAPLVAATQEKNSREPTDPGNTTSGDHSSRPKEIELVGQITGLADCRLADSDEAPPASNAAVRLGQKYAIDLGLMEITYQTGARVILQGPCTYQVESAAGGFLSLGKLTARVETKKSEVRGQGAEPTPHSPLPSPLFAVRTPTAVVTDLGTEFGVEVTKEGTTTSHVFRGSVRVALATGSEPDGGRAVVLRENESARVENVAGSPRFVARGVAANPPRFARWLEEPPKLLDLLDIVAGGDGRGQRRERGINPITGRPDWQFIAHDHNGNHHFAAIGWHKFIDGVFIPDGAAGAVQLDSAGHFFGGFPPTENKTFGSIGARAADVRPQDRISDKPESTWFWIFLIGERRELTPEGRGLLAFHANVGMTFNLEAVRRAYPGSRPVRFHTVAGLAASGNVAGLGVADLWVFVDGRVKLKRSRLRSSDGAVKADVDLGPDDRFLTIVAADGYKGIGFDWVVFGDPTLQMTSTESKNSTTGQQRAKGDIMNGP